MDDKCAATALCGELLGFGRLGSDIHIKCAVRLVVLAINKSSRGADRVWPDRSDCFAASHIDREGECARGKLRDWSESGRCKNSGRYL